MSGAQNAACPLHPDSIPRVAIDQVLDHSAQQEILFRAMLAPRAGDPVVDGAGRRGIYLGDVPGPAGRDGWGIYRVGETDLRARNLRRAF